MDIEQKAEQFYGDFIYDQKLESLVEFALECYHAGLREGYEDAARVAEEHGGGNPISLLHHAGSKIAEAIRGRVLEEAQSVGKEGEE